MVARGAAAAVEPSGEHPAVGEGGEHGERVGFALGGQGRGCSPRETGVGGGTQEYRFGFGGRRGGLGPCDGDATPGADRESGRRGVDVKNPGTGGDALRGRPAQRGGVERRAADDCATGGGFNPSKPDGAIGRAGQSGSGGAGLRGGVERLDLDRGWSGFLGGEKTGDQRKAGKKRNKRTRHSAEFGRQRPRRQAGQRGEDYAGRRRWSSVTISKSANEITSSMAANAWAEA